MEMGSKSKSIDSIGLGYAFFFFFTPPSWWTRQFSINLFSISCNCLLICRSKYFGLIF